MVAFPMDGGCSHSKAATVYAEKQLKRKKLNDGIRRKRLS